MITSCCVNDQWLLECDLTNFAPTSPKFESSDLNVKRENLPFNWISILKLLKQTLNWRWKQKEYKTTWTKIKKWNLKLKEINLSKKNNYRKI